MAALEEFIQEKYVENYEEISMKNSKILGMIEIPDISQYFYKPPIGILKYVVDSDGNALYLINKSNLPDEIKNELVGGDAGGGEYSNYQLLKDVYGVTSDLKVYYCSDGKETIVGVLANELDKEDELRTVFEDNPAFTKYLVDKGYDKVPKDGKINVEETKQIWQLELDESCGLSDLTALYNLIALQELVIKVNLKSLDGIEFLSQLTKLEVQDCSIEDYGNLVKASFLNQLIFNDVVDDEVDRATESIKNTDFPTLETLGVINSKEGLTTVEGIGLLNKIKDTVKNLKFSANTSVKRYDALSGFVNVVEVNVENSKSLETLSFISEMDELKNLYANNTGIKDTETEMVLSGLAEKKKLSVVWLENNSGLKYLSGIVDSGVKILNTLKLGSCPNLLPSEVAKIADIYNKIAPPNRSIDQVFEQYLDGQSKIVYSNKNLTDDSKEIKLLENMSNGLCLKVECVRLEGNSNLSNEKLNSILSKFKNVKAINLNNCHNLTSIEFIKNTPNLKELLIYNTGVKTGTKDESGNLNGLDLINNYGNIYSLEINNSDYNDNGVNISNVVKVVNRCKRDCGDTGLLTYDIGVCRISNLVSQLKDCKDFNYLELSKFADGGTIDMSNWTQTIGFGLTSGISNTLIILPPHISKIRFNAIDNLFNFDYCKYIDFIQIEQRALSNLLKISMSLSNKNIDIGSIQFEQMENIGSTEVTQWIDGKMYTFTDCVNLYRNNKVNQIYFNKFNSKGSFSPLAVDSLDFSVGFEKLDTFYANYYVLSNLNFLKDCSGLKHIECYNSLCSDIEELDVLENVDFLCLENAKLSSLRAIRNFNKLEYLNVKNNLIGNTWNYVTNEDDPQTGGKVIESGKNVDILKTLHSKALRRLFIDNNVGFTDGTILAGLGGWIEKSGF